MSRLETNVSTQTTCRFTVRSPLRGCVVPSQVSPGTLLAEPEFNALVVVWSGERSTRGTTRITGCDTAQAERILDKTCDHSTPLDSRLYQASVPSCVLLSTRVRRTVSIVMLLSPHFVQFLNFPVRKRALCAEFASRFCFIELTSGRMPIVTSCTYL